MEIKLMKKWKCKLNLHDYENVGTQHTKNIVGGLSMTQLTRDVKKCKVCGKIHFIGYDIATNAHLDETIDWYPKLNY